MSADYDEVTAALRAAYDAAVDVRAAADDDTPAWKQREQQRFLEVLQAEGRTSLLEIGAGTGRHGRFFADAGLEVVCTDLSPAMVDHCRSVGLEAHVRDFLHLDLGRRFDAIFAMNCLLHVPRGALVDVLGSVRQALVPGGVFFLGQYGGIVQDGVFADDTYEPKRFFSWLTDDEMLAAAGPHFQVEGFEAVDIGSRDDTDGGAHFQSLLLRARP